MADNNADLQNALNDINVEANQPNIQVMTQMMQAMMQIIQQQQQGTQQNAQVIEGLSNTMGSIQRKMTREEEKMPPITTYPQPFEMYKHFTSKNYAHTVLRGWMEKTGIPERFVPLVIKYGWPKKKDQVNTIVEQTRVNGAFNADAAFQRIDAEIVHINMSVLHSMFANIKRQNGQLYSSLLHNIKTLANVVHSELQDDQRLVIIKNKFKEIVRLERSSESRNYVLSTVLNHNFDQIDEFRLQQQLWDCEQLFGEHFNETPSPRPAKRQDDEMDVSALSSGLRANKNGRKQTKKGGGRGQPSNNRYVICPNTSCQARYHHGWLYHKEKRPHGYRWCGACKTDLKQPSVHQLEDTDDSDTMHHIQGAYSKPFGRQLRKETFRNIELIRRCERDGPKNGMESKGNWASSTQRRVVGTRSEAGDARNSGPVNYNSLTSFVSDEDAYQPSLGRSITEQRRCRELETLDDLTLKKSNGSSLSSCQSDVGQHPEPTKDKMSRLQKTNAAPLTGEENYAECPEKLDESASNCLGANLEFCGAEKQNYQNEQCKKLTGWETQEKEYHIDSTSALSPIERASIRRPRRLSDEIADPIYLQIKAGEYRKTSPALVDTGSKYSIMHLQLFNYLRTHNVIGVGPLRKTNIQLSVANKNPMGVSGEADIVCTLRDSAGDEITQNITDLDDNAFYFNKWKCENPKHSINLIEEIVVDELTAEQCNTLNEESSEKIIEATPTFTAVSTKNDEHTLTNGQTLKICHERSPKFKSLITKLFNSYADILIDNDKNDIGVNTKYIAELRHTTKPPTCYKYMASKPLHRKIMEEKVDKLINQGVVEYTNEPANSQTFLVEKHNSFPIDDQRHYRVVNDLRTYNQTVCPHVFHNRTAKDMLSEFCSSKMFSVTDASDAYHTVTYKSEFPIVSTIPGSNRNIKWKRLPQGLTNAGAFYAEAMETCFPRTEFPQCARYADDSMIHTDTEDDHFHYWTKLLKRYRDSGLKLDVKSTRIGYPEVEFLNFKIANQKYTIGEKHMQTIRQLTNWKKPVDTVVGFLQYLSDFLKNDQSLLHKLRRQATDGWTNSNKDLVEAIQSKLLSSEHLGVPDHTTPVHIFVDASNEGFASGLFTSIVNKSFDKMSKEEKQKLQLCSFYSKDCADNKRWSNKSTYEQELCGLADAKVRYDFYINGSHPVYIYTDNKSVAESAKSRSPKIRAMFDELRQYKNVKLVKIETKINLADVFTREMKTADVTVNVVTRRAARKQVPEQNRAQIMENALAFHREGGHPSAERIRKFLDERYPENPGLVPTRKEIEERLKDCICQQRKIDHGREAFQIPTPKSTNHVIYIDYKNLNGMKILSILEGLTGAYFPIPVKNEETRYLIEEMTKFMMIYGRCKTIVADNGKTFASEEFKKFCTSLGINLKFVNIYSPKANKAERPHSTLNRALQLAKESKETKSGTIFGHTDLLKFSWTQNAIPKPRTNHSPFEIIKGGFCYGLYAGSDELPEELHPEYKNNSIAEDAIQVSLAKAYDRFTNHKQPETLNEGDRVRWTKRQNAISLERDATVIYDNISSVLVQFDNISSPAWVAKADLTKIINN